MRTRSKVAIAFLALVIALLAALQTPLLRPIRNAAWTVWFSTVARFFRLSSLNDEQTITTQLRELQAANARLRSQEREYAQILEQLGSPPTTSLRAIPAELGVRPIDGFHSQLILNRGTRDGVTAGAPVVVYGSTLIGFIQDLHVQTAVVQLLLAPSTSISAEVLAENGTPKGLVQGRQYTSLTLTTVPRDAELNQGDTVVTTGREGVPGGLLLGTISAVHNQENRAYQEANLALPYDPDALQAVNILVAP